MKLSITANNFCTKVVFVFFSFTVAINTSTFAQELTGIDSLYLKAFTTFPEKMNEIKEAVWPGMKIGPSCIFRVNGPAFLINHPLVPGNARHITDSIYVFNQRDYALMGTSQTEIDGHLTAHNNYGQSFYISENQFLSELFHELHHVYQRNYIKKLQFDNPAELLTYPEDYRNDAIKQYEYERLLEMVMGPAITFQQNLNEFYSCRIARQKLIGSKYLNYEKNVESAEGPATYCEYMYMKAFGTTEKEREYIGKRFFYSLIEPTYGRNGLRNKHLLSGMIQCLLLSKHFENWHADYYNAGLTLSDYFFSKFKPTQVELPDLSGYEAKTKYFTAIEKEKHAQRFEDFNNQSGTKVTIIFNNFPQFKGFDPMHAEAVTDSVIMHSTLLKLGKGENFFNAVNHKAVTQTNGQIWFVKRLSFFVPEREIHFDGNTLSCKNENIDMTWNYVRRIKEGDDYIITVE